MSFLHNTYPKKKLQFSNAMLQDSRITLSFYKYCSIKNPLILRNRIYKVFYKLKVFGRIYVSKEGINAQISILKKKYHILKIFLSKLNKNFKRIHINKALDFRLSFWMLKVKVRKKIVVDGLPKCNLKNTGEYLYPFKVNKMLKKKNVVCVDVRNNYEYRIGHFINSINIPGSTFKQQLKNIIQKLKQFKTKNIVMYCTGGIRCEKATAWLKLNNFKNVYHIKGGILNYVNEIRKSKLPVQFIGKNFVFDYRISEVVSNDILISCENCENMCDNYINCYNDFCHRLFIQCKLCYIKYNGYCSINCKIKHIF